MRPLTDTCPKPLLKVRGKSLMQWHLEALASAGCPKVVVNTAWLGTKIEDEIHKEYATLGIPVHCSHEGKEFGKALETAGGIARALPLLCESHGETPASDVFWVVAGDVFAPKFKFESKSVEKFKASAKLAHIWMVPNPVHNAKGDFGLKQNASEALAQILTDNNELPSYTYSTIGLYRKELFEQRWSNIVYGNSEGVVAPLAPILRAAMRENYVSAELYEGEWTDVGTPERLALLNAVDHDVR